MRDPSESSPSPLSVGVSWAYRISAIGLEFAVPALVGSFLDRRWDTAPTATLTGACLGFAMGMFHLIRVALPTRSNDSTG